MLLDNKYTIIPLIEFTLTYDTGDRKKITVKTRDKVLCSYKKNGEKFIIKGVVSKIGCNYNSSLTDVSATSFMQIDGSNEYDGEVIYVQPNQVLDMTIISTTSHIDNVVCSVDNEDLKISMIKENENGIFQYSSDGLTWKDVSGISSSSGSWTAHTIISSYTGDLARLEDTVQGSINLKIFGHTDPTTLISDSLSKIIIRSENDEYDQTLFTPKHIYLRSIPVTKETSKPNLTLDGQDYVADCVMEYNGSIGVLRRLQYIDYYNGENIPGEYLSSTGDLTLGAQVVYQYNTEGSFEPFDSNFQARYKELHTYDGYTRIATADNFPISVMYHTDLEKYVQKYIDERITATGGSSSGGSGDDSSTPSTPTTGVSDDVKTYVQEFVNDKLNTLTINLENYVKNYVDKAIAATPDSSETTPSTPDSGDSTPSESEGTPSTPDAGDSTPSGDDEEVTE